MRKENKKNKGFSLVELIIVIAIMVILGAIIAPQYFKHVNNAKKSSDIETAARISAAISAEYAEKQASGEATTLETGAWTLVEEIDDITGTVGKSKVEKTMVFFYNLSTAGDVQIGVALPAAATVDAANIIAPLNALATKWK